jgi:hypothetical protein
MCGEIPCGECMDKNGAEKQERAFVYGSRTKIDAKISLFIFCYRFARGLHTFPYSSFYSSCCSIIIFKGLFYMPCSLGGIKRQRPLLVASVVLCMFFFFFCSIWNFIRVFLLLLFSHQNALHFSTVLPMPCYPWF